MKTRSLTIAALGASLMLAALTPASAAFLTPRGEVRADHRVTHQTNKIDRAQVKGHITPQQASSLRSKDASIRSQAAVYGSDGRLNHRERRTLNREEHQVGKKLHRDAQ